MLACRANNCSRNGSSKRLEALDRAILVSWDSGLCHGYLPCCSPGHSCLAENVTDLTVVYLKLLCRILPVYCLWFGSCSTACLQVLLFPEFILFMCAFQSLTQHQLFLGYLGVHQIRSLPLRTILMYGNFCDSFYTAGTTAVLMLWKP